MNCAKCAWFQWRKKSILLLVYYWYIGYITIIGYNFKGVKTVLKAALELPACWDSAWGRTHYKYIWIKTVQSVMAEVLSYKIRVSGKIYFKIKKTNYSCNCPLGCKCKRGNTPEDKYSTGGNLVPSRFKHCHIYVCMSVWPYIHYELK